MNPTSLLQSRLKNEKPELLVRRHWFVPTKIISALVLAGFIPVVIYEVFLYQFPNILANPIVAPILILLASFYCLLLWLLALQELMDFYLDTWIVTNERVIDVEQFGLFRREIQECHLSNVQDATSQMKGLIATFLRFGDVVVQTAGEKGQLVFREVPNPDAVRELILRLANEDRERHEKNQTSSTPT